jgi:hypothetical protein
MNVQVAEPGFFARALLCRVVHRLDRSKRHQRWLTQILRALAPVHEDEVLMPPQARIVGAR